MDSTGDSSSLSANATLTTGTDDEWATYLSSNQGATLSDIFGASNGGTAVVTRVRVLLDQLKKTLQDLFTRDTNFSCKTTTPLSEGDSITIAFYGPISNGKAGDHYFNCSNKDQGGFRTSLYGKDSQGTVRYVQMSDVTTDNSQDSAVRGTSVRIRSSIYSTYSEKTEDGSTVVYIDLQFAHSTNYDGPDGVYGNNDDMFFKSRSTGFLHERKREPCRGKRLRLCRCEAD